MIKIRSRYYLYTAGIGVLVSIALLCYLFFSTFAAKDGTHHLYIDADDNTDSIVAKLDTIANTHSIAGFTILARYYQYDKSIKTGHYVLEPGESTFRIFRLLQLGRQTPVRITIPSVRTVERLAASIDRQLMLDSASIATILTDNEQCRQLGYDTTTIAAFIIPNTYEVYWNIGLEAFMKRMSREHDAFWNGKRSNRAKEMGMTPIEVVTLASIVDEETANNGEKPTIAGLYLNRLRIGMPLQADPTVKFAMRKFKLRRIYKDMLKTQSPYNTYLNKGLPPGPIRIPSVAGIDAVLNHAKHNYLYMCAKEDFSGTHNFSASYQEHLRNARRYAHALNQRGIK